MIAGAGLPGLKLETSPLKLNSVISRLHDLYTGSIGVIGDFDECLHKSFSDCRGSYHFTKGPCRAVAVGRQGIALCENRPLSKDRTLLSGYSISTGVPSGFSIKDSLLAKENSSNSLRNPSFFPRIQIFN